MEVRAPAKFLVRVHKRSPSVNESDPEILLSSDSVLEHCWSAVRSNENPFLEATARQLERKMVDHAFGTLSESSGRDCRAHARKILLDITSSAAQEGGERVFSLTHHAAAPFVWRPARDGTSPLWAQLHTPLLCCARIAERLREE